MALQTLHAVELHRQTKITITTATATRTVTAIATAVNAALTTTRETRAITITTKAITNEVILIILKTLQMCVFHKATSMVKSWSTHLTKKTSK